MYFKRKVLEGFMYKSNKRTKRVMLGVAVALVITVLSLTGVGIFASKHGKELVPANPLSWSTDAWDGASLGSEEFLTDYGNRGSKTITIESAKSFNKKHISWNLESSNYLNIKKATSIHIKSRIERALKSIFPVII